MYAVVAHRVSPTSTPLQPESVPPSSPPPLPTQEIFGKQAEFIRECRQRGLLDDQLFCQFDLPIALSPEVVAFVQKKLDAPIILEINGRTIETTLQKLILQMGSLEKEGIYFEGFMINNILPTLLSQESGFLEALFRELRCEEIFSKYLKSRSFGVAPSLISVHLSFRAPSTIEALDRVYERLKEHLHISEEEARSLLKSVRLNFPGVNVFRVLNLSPFQLHLDSTVARPYVANLDATFLKERNLEAHKGYLPLQVIFDTLTGCLRFEEMHTFYAAGKEWCWLIWFYTHGFTLKAKDAEKVLLEKSAQKGAAHPHLLLEALTKYLSDVPVHKRFAFYFSAYAFLTKQFPGATLPPLQPSALYPILSRLPFKKALALLDVCAEISTGKGLSLVQKSLQEDAVVCHLPFEDLFISWEANPSASLKELLSLEEAPEWEPFLADLLLPPESNAFPPSPLHLNVREACLLCNSSHPCLQMIGLYLLSSLEDKKTEQHFFLQLAPSLLKTLSHEDLKRWLSQEGEKILGAAFPQKTAQWGDFYFKVSAIHSNWENDVFRIFQDLSTEERLQQIPTFLNKAPRLALRLLHQCKNDLTLELLLSYLNASSDPSLQTWLRDQWKAAAFAIDPKHAPKKALFSTFPLWLEGFYQQAHSVEELQKGASLIVTFLERFSAGVFPPLAKAPFEKALSKAFSACSKEIRIKVMQQIVKNQLALEPTEENARLWWNSTQASYEMWRYGHTLALAVKSSEKEQAEASLAVFKALYKTDLKRATEVTQKLFTLNPSFYRDYFIKLMGDETHPLELRIQLCRWNFYWDPELSQAYYLLICSSVAKKGDLLKAHELLKADLIYAQTNSLFKQCCLLLAEKYLVKTEKEVEDEDTLEDVHTLYHLTALMQDDLPHVFLEEPRLWNSLLKAEQRLGSSLLVETWDCIQKNQIFRDHPDQEKKGFYSFIKGLMKLRYTEPLFHALQEERFKRLFHIEPLDKKTLSLYQTLAYYCGTLQDYLPFKEWVFTLFVEYQRKAELLLIRHFLREGENLETLKGSLLYSTTLPEEIHPDELPGLLERGEIAIVEEDCMDTLVELRIVSTMLIACLVKSPKTFLEKSSFLLSPQPVDVWQHSTGFLNKILEFYDVYEQQMGELSSDYLKILDVLLINSSEMKIDHIQYYSVIRVLLFKVYSNTPRPFYLEHGIRLLAQYLSTPQLNQHKETWSLMLAVYGMKPGFSPESPVYASIDQFFPSSKLLELAKQGQALEQAISQSFERIEKGPDREKLTSFLTAVIKGFHDLHTDHPLFDFILKKVVHWLAILSASPKKEDQIRFVALSVALWDKLTGVIVQPLGTNALVSPFLAFQVVGEYLGMLVIPLIVILERAENYPGKEGIIDFFKRKLLKMNNEELKMVGSYQKEFKGLQQRARQIIERTGSRN